MIVSIRSPAIAPFVPKGKFITWAKILIGSKPNIGRADKIAGREYFAAWGVAGTLRIRYMVELQFVSETGSDLRVPFGDNGEVECVRWRKRCY